MARRPITAWVRGVNSYLPSAVSVLWAEAVPESFHARFSACGRSYRYVLLNHPVRPALLHGRVGWCHNPLHIESMREASRYLLGVHDFSAFRAAECQAKSAIKHLSRLSIRQQNHLIVFDLQADAFLHHMVRNIVGCLVQIGKGRVSADWMQQVLCSRDRSQAAATFSPDGLYLSGVTYDTCWDSSGVPQAAIWRAPDMLVI